jgi:ABC-type sugar transport system substrate-binding protein
MQSDGLGFDFTEDEMYRALRLVASETEARQQAATFAAEYEPGMDWATSEHALLLLSLGSETARARVERIRRAMQESRRDTWLQQQQIERIGESPDGLAQHWADVVAREDEDWARRLSELRRRFQEEGELAGG